MTALIVGFGNPDRGDDAAGPLAARLLASLAVVRVLERHDDALALLEEWRGASALVLIDAAAPMGEPGRIHEIDLCQGELPRACAFASTHAFGLSEAVALGRRLGSLPARAKAYAIEGENFAPGAALSPAVAAAVARLAARGTALLAFADT